MRDAPVVDSGAPRRAGGVGAVGGHPAFPAQLLPALSLGRRRCTNRDTTKRASSVM